VELDASNPCYEIDHTEVDMDDSVLIGEVSTASFLKPNTYT